MGAWSGCTSRATMLTIRRCLFLGLLEKKVSGREASSGWMCVMETKMLTLYSVFGDVIFDIGNSIEKGKVGTSSRQELVSDH